MAKKSPPTIQEIESAAIKAVEAREPGTAANSNKAKAIRVRKDFCEYTLVVVELDDNTGAKIDDRFVLLDDKLHAEIFEKVEDLPVTQDPDKSIKGMLWLVYQTDGVAGIIALVLVCGMMYLVISRLSHPPSKDENSSFELPAQLWTLITAVVSFYFGRKGK